MTLSHRDSSGRAVIRVASGALAYAWTALSCVGASEVCAFGVFPDPSAGLGNQAGYMYLRDAEFGGDGALRHPGEEAEIAHPLLALGETADAIPGCLAVEHQAKGVVVCAQGVAKTYVRSTALTGPTAAIWRKSSSVSPRSR
ncbi:hypothetical protein [Streptomyces anulatus]